MASIVADRVARVLALLLAASSLTFFQTPSKGIACAYSHGGGQPSYLRCDVDGVVAPPKRPRACELDYGGAFGLGVRTRAERLCVGDTVRDPHAKTLAYGKARRYGPFTCTARTTGLRCTTRAGHGFVLARERQKLF
jgi:hypothetical protein